MGTFASVRARWRLLLNIVTIVALLVLAYAIRHQLAVTLSNLGRVKAWVLVLMIPLEALNYDAQTRLYQKLFGLVDERTSYRDLLKVSLELNFVNHVFPSGGVSGLSYFGLRMRQFGVRGTKATLVQTMKLMLLFITFEPLLLLGMVILAINGKASNLTVLIASSLSMLVIFGTGILLYIVGSQARINTFLTNLTATLNYVISIVRPHHPETISIAKARVLFEDFHKNYILLRSRYYALKEPLVWAFIANLSEVLVIYVVYIAFGAYVNLGAIILAYSVANFAGLVSVLPGGVGIYEALMTAILLATGIPARLSFPVTVMYRVLNTLLQVPPGYVLYHRALHMKGKVANE